MKTIIAIIAVVLVASVSSAQLIYSSVRVRVDTATPCPSAWTRQTETAISPARFFIRAPQSIGGRSFLVTQALVDLLWDTPAKRATAISTGTLTVEASTTADKIFCALLP